MNIAKALALVAATVCASPSLQANFSYYYTGQNFTQFFGVGVPDPRITAIVTFAAPLGPNATASNFSPGDIYPISWSINQADPSTGPGGLFLQTDGIGRISFWQISGVMGGPPTPVSINYFTTSDRDAESFVYYSEFGSGTGPSGVWTSDPNPAVPEPYLFLPLAFGCAGIIAYRRVA